MDVILIALIKIMAVYLSFGIEFLELSNQRMKKNRFMDWSKMSKLLTLFTYKYLCKKVRIKNFLQNNRLRDNCFHMTIVPQFFGQEISNAGLMTKKIIGNNCPAGTIYIRKNCSVAIGLWGGGVRN